MIGADLYAIFEQQLGVAERQFEQTKAELFREPLSPDQFASRRAYTRELEVCLGNLHETRRAMMSLRG